MHGKFFLHVYIVMVQVIFPAPFQVGTILAFVFVLAGMPYAIRVGPNFSKGDGSVGDFFQLANVPHGSTITE